MLLTITSRNFFKHVLNSTWYPYLQSFISINSSSIYYSFSHHIVLSSMINSVMNATYSHVTNLSNAPKLVWYSNIGMPSAFMLTLSFFLHLPYSLCYNIFPWHLLEIVKFSLWYFPTHFFHDLDLLISPLHTINPFLNHEIIQILKFFYFKSDNNVSSLGFIQIKEENFSICIQSYRLTFVLWFDLFSVTFSMVLTPFFLFLLLLLKFLVSDARASLVGYKSYMLEVFWLWSCGLGHQWSGSRSLMGIVLLAEVLSHWRGSVVVGAQHLLFLVTCCARHVLVTRHVLVSW